MMAKQSPLLHRPAERRRTQTTFLLVMRHQWKTVIIFGLGLVIGWLGGTSVSLHRYVDCEITSWHATKFLNTPPSVVNANTNDDESNSALLFYQENWHSIDVFVGPRVANTTEEGKWVAQAKQDEAIFSLLHNKTNGFFVDLAANDAMSLSNTYSLERFHNWEGICIEPNPIYWYNLTHYRPNCHIVGAVVGAHRNDPISFYYEAGDHGGIAGDGFDNGAKFRAKSQVAYTVPLQEILQRYNGENGSVQTIDYLSLDVEGAEDFILQNFPMDQYTIHLLTVERPKERLRALLEEHGFQQIQRLSRWGETLWSHKDILPSLDTSRLDEFSGRRQYQQEKEKRQSQQVT